MENETTGSEKEIDNTRLLEVLEKLEKGIAEQNSFKYSLFRGMIYGLGTVVGATVLVAFLGGILASTLGDLSDTPLQGLIEQPAE